jgi:regulatory protein
MMMARPKIEHYCAWQERCQKEVRNRLYDWGLHTDEVEALISEMIQKGFLNEERFAKAYCRGKFNQKKWGKIKILRELKARDISERNIKTGLQEIDLDAYDQVLNDWITKAFHKYKSNREPLKSRKVIHFLLQKGFEYELIADALKEYKDS